APCCGTTEIKKRCSPGGSIRLICMVFKEETSIIAAMGTLSSPMICLTCMLCIPSFPERDTWICFNCCSSVVSKATSNTGLSKPITTGTKCWNIRPSVVFTMDLGLEHCRNNRGKARVKRHSRAKDMAFIWSCLRSENGKFRDLHGFNQEFNGNFPNKQVGAERRTGGGIYSCRRQIMDG